MPIITTAAVVVFVITMVVGFIAACVYFWNDIREFLNGTVRDIIERVFGTEWGYRFADLIIWLDKGVNVIKRTLQERYKWFLERVLKIKTKYDKIDGKTAVKKTTVLVQLPDGTYEQTTYEQPVRWHDMPDAVRAEYIRHPSPNSDEIDVMKDVIDKKYQETLTMAH